MAPEKFPDMPAVGGVRMASAACGIKHRERLDVLLVELPDGTDVAGVFTRSKTAAAPIDWCRDALASGQARGLVVNSGNANAFTAQGGIGRGRGDGRRRGGGHRLRRQ